MFSSLLESAKVRLFQATDAFERTKAVYKTFKQSKEEKLYVIKRISPIIIIIIVLLEPG
jgi:hypothetical protein